MGKKVKWILAITVLIIVILILQSVMSGGEAEVAVKEQFPLVEISSQKQGSSDSESAVEPGIESYSGSGDTTLNDVILESGVLIIRSAHEGSGDFGVSIVGEEATQVSFNETGKFAGSVAHSVYKASDFSGDPGEGKKAYRKKAYLSYSNLVKFQLRLPPMVHGLLIYCRAFHLGASSHP